MSAEHAHAAEFLVELTSLAANFIVAADAVMDGMRGDVGLPRGATSAEAAPIIRPRIDAYYQARESLSGYCRAFTATLESRVAP